MRIDPDVIRKSCRVPRSYREATGQFYRYEETDIWERIWWRRVLVAGYAVVALYLLGIWK